MLRLLYRVVLLAAVLVGWTWAGVASAQSPPQGVGIAAVGTQSVTATWDANPAQDMVRGYRVGYGTSHGQYSITIDVGNTLTTQITGLAPGTTYYFVVLAYNATGQSPLSAEVTFTTPGDPNCVFPLGADVIQVFPTEPRYTGSGGPGSRFAVFFQVASPNSPITSVALISNGIPLPPLPGAANPMTGPNVGSLGAQWITIPTASGTYPISIAVNNAYGCPRVQSTSFTLTVP